jgi:putative (di)nucleoside polyphosphate hydrolase
MSKSAGLFRLGVGIILLNESGKVFVAQRLDNAGPAWQMPQGGIDEGETAEEAVRRELVEEIGTDKFCISYLSDKWYEYLIPVDIASRIWGGRYIGQRQKWALCHFTGKDSDININTHNPEFSAWKWVDYQEVPKLIVDFKRGMYTEIINDFKHMLTLL